MKKEDYVILNEYLNKISLYMFDDKQVDCYFCDYIYYNDIFFKYFNSKKFVSRDIKTNNLSFYDILNYSREIIKSINNDYVLEFDNLLNSGKIDFSYDDKYNDSHVYYSGMKDTISVKLININRKYTYDDISTLIHEFMHYIATLLYSFDNKVITEFISIYFELYSNEYLCNNYDINLEELEYDKRFFSNYMNSLLSKTIDLPLLIYSRFGNLNNNSYKDLKKIINDYSRNKYLVDVKRAIDSINRFDERILYISPLVEAHYYMYATLLSFYARENCNMKDIVDLANNAKNDDLEILDLLKKYNIKLDDSFINKTIESMDNYLEIFNKKKQRIK